MPDSYGFGLDRGAWQFRRDFPTLADHIGWVYQEAERLPDAGNCLHRADFLHYPSYAAYTYHVHMVD